MSIGPVGPEDLRSSDTARYDLSRLYRVGRTPEEVDLPPAAAAPETDGGAEAAVRSERRRRALLGFVLQDCRPAANAIVAYAEHLLGHGGDMTPDQRAMLELIRRNAVVLARTSSRVARAEVTPSHANG